MFKNLSLSISPQILVFLDELCNKYGLSRSDVIRRAIQDYHEKMMAK